MPSFLKGDNAMTRFHLLLTLACVTGAAAALAPKSAPPKLRAAGVVHAAATGVPTKEQPVNIGWLARYGSYNARQGSWSLLPNRNGDGC